MTPRDAAHYALTVTLDRLNWEPLDLAHHIGCNPRIVARWVSGYAAANGYSYIANGKTYGANSHPQTLTADQGGAQ